ncbi:histidine ammonia-lyase-like isoform X2 [Bradysia coprophila]|uniref:histidine ammonia-lyase-like isoform X2 n=1 Tax=Bradysia coprophila TaxID=38358 RepID=UPI00187DB3B6|nr:histidine ammonia-lyase-like isoform X2 [Bradysia coprophila]
MSLPTAYIGLNHIDIETIGQIANMKCKIALSDDDCFVNKITKGPQLIKQLLAEGRVIYGVTTGLGASCETVVEAELMQQYPNNVIQYHGSALGPLFSPEETRAIIAARLVSLAKGNSGVRMELLQALACLLQHDILPRIPQEGSVGASGDLSHLSYIGAVICGFRTVNYLGKVMKTSEVLEIVGAKPIVLEYKEALGIINGTSAMTGVAILAWQRAQRLSQLATRVTALAITALKGNRYHYEKELFEVKNHKGMQLVAERIRSDLSISAPEYHTNERIQDRYSTRCAPHVIGVLEDVLSFTKGVIETELNSTNDNPVIDVNVGRVYHGGMFYGGHIAMAMDTLKVQVASVADLLDRQMAILVNTNYNNGLPADLTGATGSRKAINHGLKGLQVTMSGWTAEALKMCMPATVFSRSTESHNQDKVSMGTIAARDCRRVIELTEQVVAGMLIAVRQALDLRLKQGEAIKFTDDIFLEPILRKLIESINEMPHSIY